MAVPTTELSAPDDPGFFPGQGEMAALVRAKDWSRTPLGPVQSWPQSLLTVVNLVLDAHYPMLVLWGPEFIQIYNDAYRPVLGKTKHPRALGQRSEECWPEIWGMIGPLFERALTRGEATWNDDFLFVLDRNGYLEETYFTFCYSAIRDETRKPGGVLVTCIETTERVLGERRLRTLRELAAQAAQAESADDACRAAAGTLTGNAHDVPFALLYLLDDGAAGKRVARLIGAAGLEPGAPASPPEADPGDDHPWPLASVAATGEPVLVADVAARFGHLPGGPWPEAPRQALVLPIPRPGRAEPAGLLVAGISPRRALDDDYRGFIELVAGHIGTAIATARAHEEERRRAEALAELDRAKTAFFSNVSHEFRTPLTLMLGPVEDALADRQDPLPAPQRARLAIAHRNSLRLLRLVNTLLEFSRIEAGRIRASYVPTDLAALTRDLASAFRSAVERAGLRLVVDCPPSPEPAYVDRDMWEKIVLNLLSNALKFTFEGEIAVSLRADPAAFRLQVRDTGTGIPVEEIPRLFERFHRVRGARARTQEGTGIGLALVQELARLHGGTIHVESEVGTGSTFTVAIPRGAAHPPADRIDRTPAGTTALGAVAYAEEALRWLPDGGGEEAILTSVASPPRSANVGVAPEPSPPNARPRILLADDNADMRDYLARLLGEEWAVEAVADGEQALARARTAAPDLVLADVMMPRLDGFGLLRALRGEPGTARIPIILLSARAGQEATVEGMARGADDYLAKPFTAQELLARVRTHLGLARLREEAMRQERAARAAVDAERGRLRGVFEQAPAFLALLRGPDHVFEFANPRYRELVGRPDPGALVGKPARQALPEVEGQGYFELLDRVYATGEAFVGTAMPVRLDRRGDGALDEVFVSFVYQPWRAADGAIEGIIALGFEVTEQVRTRQRIEALAAEKDRLAAAAQELASVRSAERRRLERLIEVLPEGVLLADATGTVVMANEAALAITGTEAGGERWPYLGIDPLARADVRTTDGTPVPIEGLPLRRSIRHGEVVRGEQLLIRRADDGRDVPLLVSAAPVRDDAGRITGAVKVFQDIGPIKELERQKDQFLAAVSHDLRNPLMAIKGHAQLSRRRLERRGAIEPERAADALREIEEAADRLGSMVNELLDATRLQMGRALELDRRPTDLVAIAQRVADEYASSAQRHVRLVTPDSAVIGDWDGVRLGRVVDNLVGNAVKYSPEDSEIVLTIDQEQRHGMAWAVVRVRDEGIGIPERDLPHIFEHFRRGSNVQGRVTGIGIGLAGARTIVEQHGGTIEVESREGSGSTFTVRLPREGTTATGAGGEGES